MVPRRILRALGQLSVAATVTLLLVFLLDRNFRVLPDSLHEYMPHHHPGTVVTDITIAACSTLNWFSSCKLDPELWHRIDKDLYLGKARFSTAYLHVRRQKLTDLADHEPIVVDVSVGLLNPATLLPDQDKEKGGSPDQWESRPGGVWVKRLDRKHATNDDKLVTAVDVLFGEDCVEVRNGWSIVGTPMPFDSAQHIPDPHLTIRRGAPPDPIKPTPRINDNGRFKIMQLADLHLATGIGICRDALPGASPECEADPRTLDFVTKTLDEEKPDLVVLSGDQVNGDTAPDAQTAIFKYADLLIQRRLPYVCIFGNHDDEGSLNRASTMELLETLPYSLSVAGPDDIDGVGNYYIEVLGAGMSSHSALTLYLLDSHSYSPNERKYPGYNWIKKNQIDWFRQTAQDLRKAHQEYTHIHMDLAFIHIPLPEYRELEQSFVGPFREPPTAPMLNTGFRDALVEQGVVMVSCGHDHVNEQCSLPLDENQKPIMWMCYGGATGFGGYAGYGGYHRKIRMFEFDMNEGRITTYKRVEAGEDVEKRLDELIIVDAGKPIPPSADQLSQPADTVFGV